MRRAGMGIEIDSALRVVAWVLARACRSGHNRPCRVRHSAAISMDG